MALKLPVVPATSQHKMQFEIEEMDLEMRAKRRGVPNKVPS